MTIKMMVSLISSIDIYWVSMHISQPRFPRMEYIIFFNAIPLNKRDLIYIYKTKNGNLIAFSYK